MRAFASTDIGKMRDMNQDNYYISGNQDKFKLYIVADGMGGYKGGEIASAIAITYAKSYIESNFESIEHDRSSIQKLIRSAIEYANMIVYEKSKENPELAGMGTTLEICLIHANRAYIGHVGDSRIYRIRKNFIRKLTTDHSYVETLVKDGTITREEALKHPKKNMLMKAIGCNSYVEPDVMVKGFEKDDILVMTSDGLTNMVTDEEIFNIIKENVTVATSRLVEKANEHGGVDNITVVIIYND